MGMMFKMINLIKFKCPNCDIKYINENNMINCDSWISELCVKSISLKQWIELK
jgi:hypothetical protein